MNSCCKQKAFTLTELLVVMVILVILFSIGVGGTNAIKGPVLAQMGGAEMTSALKRAHKSAVKNGIPSAIVFQTISGNTTDAQTAIFASDGQLETYFGFEDVLNNTSVTANGMKTGQILKNIAHTELIDGYFGNGLYIDNDYYSISDASMANVLSSGNIIYMEAQVRYGTSSNPGISGTNIIGFSNYSIRVDINGGVFGYDNSTSFPATNRPNINSEKWRKVGLMFVKGRNFSTGYFFIDGVLINTAITINTNTSNTLSIGNKGVNNGTYVDIDEIKVYNLMKSDMVSNDLKSGFFVTNNREYSGSGTNSRKNIILNAQGGLTGGTSDFIAFASTYVTGTGVSITTATPPRLTVKGAFASNLPESGYLLFSIANSLNVELIQYRDFSNNSMTVVQRNVTNDPSNPYFGSPPPAAPTIPSLVDRPFYYAIPVIFNSDGSIQ